MRLLLSLNQACALQWFLSLYSFRVAVDSLCLAQEDMAAADVAKMVDMSPTEVADLLGQGARNGPGAYDAAALAQEVVCVLMQLETALCVGVSASYQIISQHAFAAC